MAVALEHLQSLVFVAGPGYQAPTDKEEQLYLLPTRGEIPLGECLLMRAVGQELLKSLVHSLYLCQAAETLKWKSKASDSHCRFGASDSLMM